VTDPTAQAQPGGPGLSSSRTGDRGPEGVAACSEPLLVADRVRKTYHTGAEEVEALRDVELVVHEGEFVSIMGPSGSGKTTLLNCCSGLDDIDGGRVLLDGVDLHALSDARRTANRASSMGFIFQAYNLIPVFSAVENAELPLLLAGVDAKEARRRASETLEQVGLGARLKHRPAELSGGEQQRVTVARALAGRPRVVWADEPTGALDSETAEQVMQLLRDLNADGLTLIVVTHDDGVGGMANRAIKMRDGRIVSDELAAGAVEAAAGAVEAAAGAVVVAPLDGAAAPTPVP
jgi:putative ABC transport system ATP-binding protein